MQEFYRPPAADTDPDVAQKESPITRILFTADRLRFEGKSTIRLPMSEIRPFDERLAEKIAARRLFETPCELTQTAATYMILAGLREFSVENGTQVILGIGLLRLSLRIEKHLRVLSSDELKALFRKILDNNAGQEAIAAELTENGIAAEDIRSMNTLPTAIGRNERGDTSPPSFLGRYGVALAAGVALPSWNLGLPVAVAGSVGAKVVGKGLRRRYAQDRLNNKIARETQDPEWEQDNHRYHEATIAQSEVIGSLAKDVPQIMRAILGTELTLSMYAAITGGLGGLASANDDEYYREYSENQMVHAIKLLRILNSAPGIYTQQRLFDHCTLGGTSVPAELKMLGISEGIILKDFLPHSFYRNEGTPINFILSKGSAVLITGKSGGGKTNLTRALGHRLEHAGDLFFVKNREVINAHRLKDHASFDAVLKRVAREDFSAHAKLEDFFRVLFKKAHDDLYRKHMQLHDVASHRKYVRNAYAMTSGTLDEVIGLLKVESKTKNYSPKSYKRSNGYPAYMLPVLQELKHTRQAWVRKYLDEYGEGETPIAKKDIGDAIGKFSPGEITALMNFYVLMLAIYGEQIAICVDEPLAQLDPVSKQSAVSFLAEAAKRTALIVISHELTEEIVKTLPDCQHIRITEQDNKNR